MTTPDARLEVLEAEVRKLNAERRRTRRVLSLAVVVGALSWVGTSFAANGLCPNGYPFCFVADTPATATEVNHNFSQIKEWLEAKVGTVGQPTRVASAATFDSTVTVTNTTTLNGVLSANGTATFGNTATFNGVTTLNNAATFNNSANFTGNFQRGGSIAVCALGTPGRQFSYCCRADQRTGATQCKIASNWNMGAWGGAVNLFSAGGNGNYTLSCIQGIDNVVFPSCCRTESNSGAVECRQFSAWDLSSSVAAANAF